jgi:hypothetical protein
VTAGLLLGCAAAGEGRVFLAPGKGYRVAIPTGWERIPSEADLALRQPGLGAGLMAHATCEGAIPRRSPGVLARHLRFGLQEVRDLSERPVEVAGQPGLASRFVARLDGQPVAVRAVTLRGDRCAWDLVLVAPPEGLERAEPDFEGFVQSFVPMSRQPEAGRRP